MNIPANLMYTASHEWVEIDGDKIRMGLTEHAVSELGDIVAVDLGEVGDEVTAEEDMGEVESVKAVSEFVSAATGKITAKNEEIEDAPESINEDPYAAWLVEIGEITAKRELLTPEQYEELLAQEA